MDDKQVSTETTREKINRLIGDLALEAYSANSSPGGYYPPRVPPNTTFVKEARAEVNNALDALFTRLDAQETALVAADVAVAALPLICPRHAPEGAAQQDMRLPCFCPVVATRSAYNTARRATKDEV